MRNELQIASTDVLSAREILPDMFAHLPDMDLLELKKDELATELAALMSFAGETRSSMAEQLGWKKSRISQVLSGNSNSTIKTILEFCEVLRYDFDVVFRPQSQPRAAQPWQKMTFPVVAEQLTPALQIFVTLQTPSQVSEELYSQQFGDMYIKLDLERNAVASTVFSSFDTWTRSPIAALTHESSSNFFTQTGTGVEYAFPIASHGE